MSEQPKPNCKVIRLGAVGALLECIEGRDDQAAELLAMLNGAELQAVENGAVALSLHASRARKAIEERAEASGR